MPKSLKIVVLGPTCTGKSSLAELIAKKLAIKHIELDDLNWLSDWRQRPDREFKKLLSEKTNKYKSWVTSGNYSIAREITWKHATHFILLEYSFPIVLYRCLIRTFKRVYYKEYCCNGNQESVRRVFSRESIVFWLLKTYWKRKKELPVIVEPYLEGATLIRLKKHRDADILPGILKL